MPRLDRPPFHPASSLLRAAALTGVLSFAAVAPCQTPAPPQTPPTSQPANSGVTLRTRANLVVVDVVVTDSHQNPIRNLKSTDFTLTENGKPQLINTFTEHIALTPADAARLEPTPVLPPGTFSNFSAAPVNGAVNVILLDALNTPMRDQSHVRSQLLDFLKKSPPGTRIAIFGLNRRLTLLQGFTTDPAILTAALDKKLPRTSAFGEGSVGGDGTSKTLTDTISITGVGNDLSETIAAVLSFENESQNFEAQVRVRFTLAAFNQLARYLAGIPGRKNLIWFSGSFPVSIVPDVDLVNDPFKAMNAGSEPEFRESMDLLARSQVAVYPVDATGFLSPPILSPATSGSRFSGPQNPRAFDRDNSKVYEQEAADHAAMEALAEETGGHAIFNTNGIKEAVGKAIGAGSNFYTLTYSPADTTWNGAFRKIQVKLQQTGLNLAYRRGYYATNPEAAAPGSPVIPSDAAGAAMRAALGRGSPEPTQIVFKVRALPSSSATEDNIVPGNKPNPDPQKIYPPFRRIALDYAADPRTIVFAPASGGYLIRIEFVALLYTPEGEPINNQANAIQTILAPAAYANMLRTGVHFHQEISVPAKGPYFLRTAVHDLSSDRVGATEVPIAAVRNLPPAPATATPQPPPAPAPSPNIAPDPHAAAAAHP